MTTEEYAQMILQVKGEAHQNKQVNEADIFEVAQLISGSFTYLLYESLWVNYFDMKAITQHLESLYDNEDNHGFVYFIFILANAVDFTVPAQLVEMSASDTFVPMLSAAIMEDWLEYDASSEPTEYN